MSNRRFLLFLLGAIVVAAILEPWSPRKSTTQLEWQPNMYRQESVHALGVDRVNPALPAMRTPPAHTIPVNYDPYPTAEDTAAIDQLVDPLPINAQTLATGQKLFNTFCIVCHGARADGLGYVVPHMTQPPPLIEGAPLQFSDGRIFTIITEGVGNMPPYQTELQPSERWAIVHYVRVLQMAANPSPEQLAQAQASGMDFSQDYPEAEGPHGPIPGTEAIPRNPKQ